MQRKLLALCLVFLFVQCSKESKPELSGENSITSFYLEIDNVTYEAEINQLSNQVILETVGLETTSFLAPTVSISPKASITPSASTTQNFNEPVEYVVTAENGEKKTYTVITVNTRKLSSEKKILSYSYEYVDEMVHGQIDQEMKTIHLKTKIGVYDAPLTIELSEGASISPAPDDPDRNIQFPITYTVTAEDGTTAQYDMIPDMTAFNSGFFKFYANATPHISGPKLDPAAENAGIFLENEDNSYELEYSELKYYESYDFDGDIVHFRIHFPENVVSADDYKLRYKVEGEIKAETERDVDILAENLPVLESANQESYQRGDTMILHGRNLPAGIMIDAYNGSDYVVFPPYVIVNEENTELQFPLTINPSMFPSYHGDQDNYPTDVYIKHQGREGMFITVEFD